MKKILSAIFLFLSFSCVAQKDAVIRQYKKVFTTYPFSDPNPIPNPDLKIYPYFRYDGFTDKPVQKEWKVVELENDFIKIMIMPEVGGKIWSAIEKSTGKSFIYYNHVIKFRDVAMRGPWTSGGIEANYGIIGHTPNCATPVDYTTMKKEDGSVSCVIGVLDLLTRTPWRLEINLPKDKAYFTTKSFWFNASGVEQPYYTWMNTGIKVKGNLQYIYPGTHYLGHEGEYGDWPINKQNGKDISYYENNNFGGYKSYHVFGKYTDFFGAYWHDDDFGMGRYSTHDDKPGKKIWIWGLSQQGMIWEKLLTDSDGQYSEVQSGRLFNQSADKSTFTPFKHRGFAPYATDVWTEYWFPVKQTKGFVKANNYGALNIKKENGWLKIYFSPLQNIDDEIKVMDGKKTIYTKTIHLKTMQPYVDSIQFNTNTKNLVVTLGENKLIYRESLDEDVLMRPLETPKDFDWNSLQGLYLQGEEFIRERNYADAEIKMHECLQKDHNYLPALSGMALLMYHKMEYLQALNVAKKSLSIDTYNPEANYYYGLINVKLKKITDAKDGFDIASQNISYRDAAYTELSKIYLQEKNFQDAINYAEKSISANKYNLDAWQIVAVAYRHQNQKEKTKEALDTILSFDPLNHLACFEKYLWAKNDDTKNQFISLIKNEMPDQTFLELGIWYYNIGEKDATVTLLNMAPQTAEVLYWLSYLTNDKAYSQKTLKALPSLSFPFREESITVLNTNDANDWKAKYYAGLIFWSHNNIDKAKELFLACGAQPNDANFYAARSELFKDDKQKVLEDLQKAIALNKNEWRFGKMLIDYYMAQNQKNAEALKIAHDYAARFPQNYIIGMLYIKTLQFNKQYAKAAQLLDKIKIIPYEGSTDGRAFYKEIHLLIAVELIKNNNCKSALGQIEKAKLWPENLGVGKPYDDQIDERLENLLSYNCYTKTGTKTAAQNTLQKILLFVPTTENTVSNFSEANSIVTAWALEKSGKKEDAKNYLEEKLKKEPDNEIIKWCINVFNGSYNPIPGNIKTDENYRLLSQYLLLKK
ncbi:MAG: DUF5107 domain-containing protein [Ginsengibacter sp.]